MFDTRRAPRRAPPLTLTLVAAVATLATSGAAHTAGQPGEVRALWVTRATLSSPAAIADMVRAAQGGGFNTLLVQVRGRGDAYYKSSYEPAATPLVLRPDFDPLAEVLARAKPAGLSVHAWVNINLVSSAATLPTSPQHVVFRHPEWLMVPRDIAGDMRGIDPKSPEYLGRIARWTRARLDDVEGLYASPIHADAAAYIANIAAEITRTYAVDGIHLDYVRFPNEQFDYSASALQQFKASVIGYMSEAERERLDAQEAVNPLAYPNYLPQRWLAFRQSRLTGLLMRVRTAVKAANPRALLSAAVVPDIDLASTTKMQDWRTWVDQSLIDVLCPMAYTTDAALYQRQIGAVIEFAGDRPVWAGVGAYRLSPTATLQHIDIARRRRAAGLVLFSYDALVAPPNSVTSLAALARAAFAAGTQE